MSGDNVGGLQMRVKQSYLVTSRNVREMLLVVALLLVTASASFIVGYVVRGVHRNAPPRCPSIDGATAVASSSTKDGEYCVYVQTYGLAKKRIRL